MPHHRACGMLVAVALIATPGAEARERAVDLASAARPVCGDGLPLVIDLDGPWDFAYTPNHPDTVPPDASFRATMPVPGCWDDHVDRRRAQSLWSEARLNPAKPVSYPTQDKPPDASLPYLLGVGWYRKQIEVPADWRGRQITLQVGRVVMQAWVYVNGRAVHHHVGHSTSWEVSLGEHLQCGRANELVIAVDNTQTGRIGSIIRGYKGRSAGIYGPVRLDVAAQARIADLYVYPTSDGNLRWQVELVGKRPPDAALRWTVRDPAQNKILAHGHQLAGASAVEWTTDTADMSPWSDRRPTLYRLEVALLSGQTRLDVRRQRFGLRRLTRDGFRLRLNGNPVYLRGTCECSYYPRTCTPPLEVEAYRRRIRRLKEVGFNWLRFHTSVPLEPYLRAADELGMLVQVEPPTGYARAQWLDILRFCRRHPSAVIYCCGNEEVLDESRIEFLRQCANDQRRLVPDALFNPQEALRGVEYGSKQQFGRGMVEKPYRHNSARLAKLKAFSDVFGQYAWGTLSYRTLAGDPRMLDERLAVYERPCLSHELGIIGCYLDLTLGRRYADTRIGTDLYANTRRNLEQAGLLDRAATYYRNSCAWQRLLRKDVIETARRSRRVTGYDFLGARDNHWHRSGYGCGLLNEFGELKPGESAADALSYNGESVLLLDVDRRRNLRMGDDFAADVLVSWFAPETLRDATLSWRLTADDGTVLRSGKHAAKAVEPGAVDRAATIRFAAPTLERPTKATLEVRLRRGNDGLSNRWDYWLFPSALPSGRPSDPAGVMVVSQLTARELSHLMQGGRAVVLGHKPWPARKIGFQMAIAGRPHGNLATVVADHPLMRRFPHDGYCGWQFRAMMDGGATVVFDEMPKAFDPIIEVVHTYKNVSKQASLFEWRVGEGRLLVCALNLPASDPGAAYLRRCILGYAAGEAFQPRTRVEPEQLARRLEVDLPKLEGKKRTDEAADPRVKKP